VNITRLKTAWRRALRANQRYEDANGDIYAAGVTYFTIFAMFPLLMMGFAAVGFVLTRRPQVLADIDSRVKAAVPGEFGQQVISLMDAAIESRTSVGVIGLGTALYVGMLWIQRLRAAISQMWGQDFPSPGFLNTKFSDVRALAAVFLASLMTVGLSAVATSALRLAGLLRVGSLLLSVLVAWLLFTVMIARLPHRPVPLRDTVIAGLLAAVGFEMLKGVGSIYLRTVMHGPAGTTFGPVLGLMVFAYMTARLVLFATAWAATDVSGPGPADSASVPPASG